MVDNLAANMAACPAPEQVICVAPGLSGWMLSPGRNEYCAVQLRRAGQGSRGAVASPVAAR
jgi:hypothetical protein